ncbi:thiamine pyrophosphate-binding protein [Candidatus Roizmanbacteria bacterium]|nr:thiamine pyrophosphate-binding protein [Candidatus Roizmanbacteria bacterium]
MVKVGDYIFDYLHKQGLTHIFLISGGGNIHLIDSVGRSKLKYVCNHHEQACATAAEGYARLRGDFGACLVTTGPGGTNAITGMLGSWLDSIPMLIISGQVRREIMGAGPNKMGMRQLGPQEINIVDIVKTITKYAVTVMDPYEIKYHLQKALHLARIGRQGPVWLDIPLDVQGSMIDEKKLKSFKPEELKPPYETDKKKLRRLVKTTLEKIAKSEKPVIYAGNGIRLAGAAKEFLQLVNKLKIPVLTSYVGYDLIPSSHPYFFGRSHVLGQRAANFVIQNSDLMLSIGARLDILTVGFTYKAFARKAYKIMVDVDKKEINKFILSIDLPINYDAKEFILEMLRQLEKKPVKLKIQRWLDYGRNLNKKYPVIQKEYWKEKKYVNPYCFIESIGKILKPGEIIIESDGVGPLNCMYQAFYVKPKQRIILNLGCAQMGYGLPAAIGAAFTAKGKRIICLEGDGSLQLNIHELQVMKHHNLNIKLFIYSNDGYLSIKNTQIGLFGGKFVATDSKSGVSSPDFVKVGRAYGLKTIRIHNHSDMERKIRYVLNYRGPILCDMNSLRELMLVPKLTTKKTPDGRFVSPPLEDMGPFLPREEFKKNMLIPLWKE